MTRNAAALLCREELDKYGLQHWAVRLNSNPESHFLGMCSHKDECIILNAYHCEINPEPEVVNTIKHEVAHALVGAGNGHNEVWEAKAREVGCTSIAACSHLNVPAHVIDAIRSGADVVMTYETEVIHRPKYEVTRLQDKCEVCGKVAKEKSSTLITNKDPFKPDEKFIFLECGHLMIKKIPKGTPFSTLTSDDGKTPYAFQIDGMNFIEQALATQKGAAVFDEMGLGKTIQVLGYLKFHPEAFPVAFIVKSSIKFQWFKEILRWLGDEYIPQIIETSKDCAIPNLKCYIASYDIFVPKTRKVRGKIVNQGFDIQKLVDAGVKTIVLDECQQIKNADASRTQEIRKLAKHVKVIALSGTPWKNRGTEFFTVLNMLNPTKFPSYEGFKQRWVNYYYDNGFLKEGGIKNPARFKEYIRDIAIRREVADVAVQMPSVNRVMTFTELDNWRQTEYDHATSEFVKWYNEAVIGGDENSFEVSSNILAKLARMRHITGLAKIPATEAFVETFLEETDRKLCIFVHHVDVGEILVKNLQKNHPTVPILQLSSDMNAIERFKVQEEFNATPICILIASTGAAGEGINLQTCGDAIMHERQWNPQNEDQAAPGRFRRIGATHDIVNVNFITAAGTVDEILAGIVERKRREFHNAMNKGELPAWNQGSIAKELAEGIVDNWNKKNRKSITKAATIPKKVVND